MTRCNSASPGPRISFLLLNALKAPARTDKVAYGKYLADIGHCMECHTPRSEKGLVSAQWGAGGQLFKGPWGTSVSRNLTPHASGLAGWSVDDIAREEVSRLQATLRERGFRCVGLSGELTQPERARALQMLRDGHARVLVATDVRAHNFDLSLRISFISNSRRNKYENYHAYPKQIYFN